MGDSSSIYRGFIVRHTRSGWRAEYNKIIFYETTRRELFETIDRIYR